MFLFVFWRKSKTPKNHYEIISPIDIYFYCSPILGGKFLKRKQLARIVLISKSYEVAALLAAKTAVETVLIPFEEVL